MSSPASPHGNHLKRLTYFPAAQCSPKTICIYHLGVWWRSSSLIQPRSAESTPWEWGPEICLDKLRLVPRHVTPEEAFSVIAPQPTSGECMCAQSRKNSGSGFHAGLPDSLDPEIRLASLASPALSAGSYQLNTDQAHPTSIYSSAHPIWLLPLILQSDGPQMVS